MAQIRNLTDKSGNDILPITHEKAVRDSNGVSLETKLGSLESKTYVEAWDGASTPVVANIPAGVTVTYNSTTYTGTLAASASTDGKVYLVKNGTEYDRYFSSLNLAGNYVWSNLGTTGMDLSDYATKDEVSQLQQKVSLEVGIVSDSYAATLDSGNANHKVVDGLDIKTGETFFVTLSGTTAASRIIIRYNVGTTNNLKDNVVIGETYKFVAPADINSLWIWYNGSVDITMDVDVAISAKIKVLENEVEELLPIEQDVNALTKEVFDQETTLIDLTTGSYDQSIDFFSPAGKEVTIKVESLSSQNVSIYASDYLNNTLKTIHSGSLSEDQVVEDTFTPERNMYKFRFVASIRGKMNVTIIGESIRESMASSEGSIGTRLTGVESVVYGAEHATSVDVREYDLHDDGIDVPIGGGAYSLVKFKIDNSANSVAVSCKLYYLSASYKELGILSAFDKGVGEVIYEIPEDFVGVRYAAHYTQRVPIQIITELDPKVTGNISETAISSNVLNPSSLVVGKDMKPDGTEIIDLGRAYTDFIKVKEGDIVVLSNDVETVAQVNSTGVIINPRPLDMRFVAVYDYNKNILPELAPDSTINHQRYVVPKGVYYIRVSANNSYLTGKGARINLGGVILPYEPYWVGTRPAGVVENERSIAKIKTFPVSEMPDYLRNILSYKPLGQLSKGYLCVSDDDGTIGLGTYTLPMVLQKDVPITFGVMKDSAIFQEGNEQYKALLLDAVNNHNCTIAQHGGVDWTEYNEMQLFEFFNREKTYWDSLGVEVKAAAIPSHKTDKIIESVAGGYFGVVRCGYEGYDASYVPSYETIHTDNYACIPRTNMFCLPSLNVRDKTLQGWMDIIDWAVENKLLINVYFHDIDYVETADDYMARRALLEGFLDYAKGHITMINLADIPKIV